MERYYNFGGEGIAAAARRGIPSLLEVNSPVVDHPGSLKAALDAALAGAARCAAIASGCAAQAAALVAPIPEIVPEFARAKTETRDLGRQRGRVLARAPAATTRCAASWASRRARWPSLFSGSFRPWHGVHVFEAAARRLRDARRPLLPARRADRRRGAGAGYRGRRLGTRALRGDAGARGRRRTSASRPTTPRACASSRLGFYWSPLKIFEYMASGLPTVTIPRAAADRDRARGPGGPALRAKATRRPWPRPSSGSPTTPALRRRLGASARARVVERYSWARHCEQLERVLLRIAGVRVVLATRGLPAARGRRGLVHARAGPGPARGRPRRHGAHHEPRAPRTWTACAVRRLDAPAAASAWPCPRAFARALAGRARGRGPRPALALRARARWAGREPERVAVTVRDHWPVCFWSTRISRGALCPGCGIAAHDALRRRPRAGARAPLLGRDPLHAGRPRAQARAPCGRAGRDPGGERGHRGGAARAPASRASR